MAVVDLILSLVGLPVAAIVCGWLASRCWHARRAVLRWLGTGLAGLVAVALAGVALVAVLGLYRFQTPPSAPVTPLQVAATPERMVRGERLANLCAGCHAMGDHLPLDGGNQNFLPALATLFAPNLTPGGPLRDWSDGEIVRAVRDGVGRDGRSLLLMPAAMFHVMSDDDVQSIVAYLRSQPAVAHDAPPTQLHLMGAVLAGLGALPMSAQSPTTSEVAAPPAGVVSAHGEYLVTVSGCRLCHGANLSGGTNSFAPRGPSLVAVVPTWSTDQFVNTLRTGTDPHGVPLPAELMPWPTFSAAWSDDELRAIDTYIRGLGQ